jgi:hypothetical protein
MEFGKWLYSDRLHPARVEATDSEKYSSLLQCGVNIYYGRRSFIVQAPVAKILAYLFRTSAREKKVFFNFATGQHLPNCQGPGSFHSTAVKDKHSSLFYHSFMKLDLNEADTFKSSSILIY